MEKIKDKLIVILLCLLGMLLMACRDDKAELTSSETSSETSEEIRTTVDYEGKYTYSELDSLNDDIAKLCEENKIRVNLYGVVVQEDLNEYRMLVELAYDATEEVEEYTKILNEQFGDMVYIIKATEPVVPAGNLSDEVENTDDYEGKYSYAELQILNDDMEKLCDENKISVNGYGVGIQEDLNEYRMLVELAYDATEEEVEEYTSILKEQFGDKVYITKADGPNIPAE